MKRKMVAAGTFLLVTAILAACHQGSGPTAPVASEQGDSIQSVSGAAKQSKTDVCHLDDEGMFILINVADPAVEAHLAHGDHFLLTFFVDADGDGYGTGEALAGCVVPDGHSNVAGDCDDTDASANPGATEVCGDNVDNNCDGQIDEGCAADTCPCDDALPIEELRLDSEDTCTESGDEISFFVEGFFMPLAMSSTESGNTQCTFTIGVGGETSSGHSDAQAQACQDLIRDHAASLGVSCS